MLIRSAERGFADHGWLKSAHTFSFASYFNRNRMNFGMLRVINDDDIAAGMGFGTHPHDNMEIITIPLEGAVLHRDSMGHESTISPPEVQVMSAGSGITHSEFNASKTDPLRLFQIWIMPDTENVTPRYDQKRFDFSVTNEWITLVQPLDAVTTGLGIHQRAQLSWATLTSENTLIYRKIHPENGVYLMVVDGEAAVNETQLHARDGLGITDPETIPIAAQTNARLLVIDVPLTR